MALPIEALTAIPAVVAKIERKHGLTFEEAEDVVFSRGRYVRRGAAGLYLVYGRTSAGRYVLVVIAIAGRQGRMVTARDMNLKERRSYGRQARR
jgi:uncharacterized DUF497 family protein